MYGKLKLCAVANQAIEVSADPLTREKVFIREIVERFLDDVQWKARGRWGGHDWKTKID